MSKEQTPESIAMVIGGPACSQASRPHRVALNINSDPRTTTFTVNSEIIVSKSELWNAVGSRNFDSANQVHLPVINIDGVSVAERDGRRLHIHVRHGNEYDSRSFLKDVLGDNGITTEIFQIPTQLEFGKRLTALVLRSQEAATFEIDSSAGHRGDTLYLQRAFAESDHEILVKELGRLGIVSREWLRVAEEEGMGIVRVPWANSSEVLP